MTTRYADLRDKHIEATKHANWVSGNVATLLVNVRALFVSHFSWPDSGVKFAPMEGAVVTTSGTSASISPRGWDFCLVTTLGSGEKSLDIRHHLCAAESGEGGHYVVKYCGDSVGPLLSPADNASFAALYELMAGKMEHALASRQLELLTNGRRRVLEIGK